MDESPSPTQVPASVRSDESQYRCHRCYKPVSIEALTNQPAEIICNDCEFSFVESIAAPPPSDEPTQFPDQSPLVEMRNGESADHSENETEGDDLVFLGRSLRVRDFATMEGRNNSIDNLEDEVDIRRRRRRFDPHGIRRSLRVRDFATIEGQDQVSAQHNSIDFASIEEHWDQIIQWTEILREEFELQVAEDTTLGRRPASKAAIAALNTVELKSEEDCSDCAVCKDAIAVGDSVKELPCRHRYHGDCILPWLAATNSCPLCRFELDTDDPGNEEEKRRRTASTSAGASSGSTHR